MQAAGGTVTDNGSYKVHAFTSNGNFTVYGKGTVKVLLIGGGGGTSQGDSNLAWGGGAGQYIYNAAFDVRTGIYAVTVGQAGAITQNGTSSIFSSLTAIGGYAGGQSGNGYAKGGDCSYKYGSSGGGGGGSSGNGGDAHPYGDWNEAGNGGPGTANSITGASVTYACGGAGGRINGGSNIGGAPGARIYGDGASGSSPEHGYAGPLAALNGIVIISFIPATADSGLRVGGEGIIFEALDATHKVRLNKNGTIVGLPLVAIDSALASKTRIYTGAAVMALAKSL